MSFIENRQPIPVPVVHPNIEVDVEYIASWLLELLRIHSPTGYTDPITRVVGAELERLGAEYELTRRGAIRVTLPGRRSTPARALVAHLDTLGAMVRELKPNGRLGLKPVGTWSSRFAEGARVSIFTDAEILRGTILPLKASGHVYNEEIDTQPVSWDDVEVRVDANAYVKQDLHNLGINIGDFIGIDSQPELLKNGFISSRHLDNKAGVAVLLGIIRQILRQGVELPTDLHVLFTISEEVGSGASAVLRGNVAEMVSIDNGTVAPGQESSEMWPSICLADSSGPFDYHLSRHLLKLCRDHSILHGRDVFRYYRCDSASAVEAGNDIRTALVTFGVDGSHGYERTHLDSLVGVARLLIAYSQAAPVFDEQFAMLDSIDQFPETRETPIPQLTPDRPVPPSPASDDEEEEEAAEKKFSENGEA